MKDLKNWPKRRHNNVDNENKINQQLSSQPAQEIQHLTNSSCHYRAGFVLGKILYGIGITPSVIHELLTFANLVKSVPDGFFFGPLAKLKDIKRMIPDLSGKNPDP